MVKKALLFGLVLAVAVTAASAQDFNWKLRGRIVSVAPDDSSDALADTNGTTVAVDSDETIEIDLTYMFNPKWGLELVALQSSHALTTQGGDLGGASAGEAKVLPPTLTLQYFLGSGDGRFHPYLGAGFSYATFSYDLSADLQALSITDVDFDDSFGLAAGLGFDFDIGKSMLLNLDAKYIDMSTDADIKVGSTVVDTITVDINPWVIGAGFGFRF